MLTAPLNLPAPGRCQSIYVASSTLHRPVFLVNSRLDLFSAALQKSGREVHFPRGHSFSRSYGVILPSSFAKNHSSTLGYSPCLRVSVCGTVSESTPIEVFLGSMIRASLWANALPIAPQDNVSPDLPRETPYTLRPGNPTPGWPFTSASPHRSNASSLVQECSPVFHRLRLSASAKGPTNPERINLPQETLGFR